MRKPFLAVVPAIAVTVTTTDCALLGTELEPDPVPVTCTVIEPPAGGEERDWLADGRFSCAQKDGCGLVEHRVSAMR